MTAAANAEHGFARYRSATDPCHCYACCFAYSQHMAEVYRLKAEGKWQPFVNADIVRAHVRELLAAGATMKGIAQTARVSRAGLNRVMNGFDGRKVAQMRSTHAKRVLAIQPGDPAVTSVLLPSAGTARRIQALAVLGWPVSQIAVRLGWSAKANVYVVMGQPWVYRETAEKVAAIYAELSMVVPEPTAGTRKARTVAKRKGWFAPLAWDDATIDDPGAVPCLLPPVDGSDPAADEWLIQHWAAGHACELSRVEEVEIVRRLLEEGVTFVEICRRLRRSQDWVTSVRREIESSAAAVDPTFEEHK